ncbi:MAG: hypothetical protein ACPGPE_08585 [Planctomycetota bacterium]
MAAAYLGKAQEALAFQTPEFGESRGLRLEELEGPFALELADAESRWASLQENEVDWIDSGEDVDARFAEVVDSEPPIGAGGGGRGTVAPVLLGLGAALIAASLVLLARRRAMASPGSAGE